MASTVYYWIDKSTGHQSNIDDMTKAEIKEALKEMIKADSLGQSSVDKYSFTSVPLQFHDAMIDHLGPSDEPDTDNPH